MPRASAHGKPFLAALFLLVLGSVFGGRFLLSANVQEGRQGEQQVIVFHRLPSSITLVRAVRPGTEVIDVRADALWVGVTLPTAWTLQDVRGVTMKELQSTVTDSGTIWALPPRSRLSFLTDRPAHLAVKGAGTGSLLVRFVTLDLATGDTGETSTLLGNGQEATFW